MRFCRSEGALIGICDGCGSPEGVMSAIHDGRPFEYHCVNCTRNMALWAAAHDHLKLLYGEALRAWGKAWATSLVVMNSVEEITHHAGIETSQEAQSILATSEEVQPLRWAA